MKTWMYLLLASVMTVVLVTACGSGEDELDVVTAGVTPGADYVATVTTPPATVEVAVPAPGAAADPMRFVQRLTQDFSSNLFRSFTATNGTVQSIANFMSDTTTTRMNTSVSLEIPDGELAQWAALFNDSAEFLDILRLLGNSAVELDMRVQLGDELEMAATLIWALNDTRVLSVEIILLGERLYVGIPELYHRFFVADLAELGINLADFELYFYTDDTLDMDALLYAVAFHEATLVRMVDDVIDAAFDAISRVYSNYGVSVYVNDRAVVYDQIRMVVTDADFADAMLAALGTLYADTAGLVAITDIANTFMALIDPWATAIGVQDVRNGLDVFIDDIIQNIADGNFDSAYSVYFHLYLLPGTDTVVGAQVDIIDVVMRFFWDAGHGFEFALHDYLDNTHIQLHGRLSGVPGNFTGDVWFDFSDRWDAFGGRLATFEYRYTDWDDYAIGVTLNLNDWLAILALDITAYLPNSDFNLTFFVEAAAHTSRTLLEIWDTAGGVRLVLEMTAEEGVSFSIDRPAQTFSDIDELLGMNLFVILGNVGTLMQNIEGLGFNVDLLDMVLGSIF